jgi:small multidrug resistance pump
MKWLIVVLGIACNASASVFVKLALLPPRRPLSVTDVTSIVTNGALIAGIVLYGLAFVLYAAALTKLPLNVAQPVTTAGAIASVALLSVAIFRESFPWTAALGIVFVIAGVVLISLRAG